MRRCGQNRRVRQHGHIQPHPWHHEPAQPSQRQRRAPRPAAGDVRHGPPVGPETLLGPALQGLLRLAGGCLAIVVLLAPSFSGLGEVVLQCCHPVVHDHVMPLQQRSHRPQQLLLLIVLRRADVLDAMVQRAPRAQERLPVDLRQPVGIPLLRGVRGRVQNQHAVDRILHPPDAVLVRSHVLIALPHRGDEQINPYQGEDDEVGPQDAHAHGPEELAAEPREHGTGVLGLAEKPQEHGEMDTAGVPPETGHLLVVRVVVVAGPHAQTREQNSKAHPKPDVEQQKHQNRPPNALEDRNDYDHISADLMD
mmetsp:Transcript_51904/g.137253  ORF Transcript_51904/g.137253 Transcript_51904/m.137253 type:complete len:308 (-) Transcript_51904:1958-2881(-)